MPLIKNECSIFAGWGAPSETSPLPKSMHGFCLKKSKNQIKGSSIYKLSAAREKPTYSAN